MFKNLLYLSTLLVAVLATGDLIVLNHPKSIAFKGHEHIEESTLKEMYSAALGFSIEQSSSWSGMYLIDPFHLAEAVVSVVVDGISDLGTDIGHHYPLRTNEDEQSTWDALKKRILDRYPETKSHLVRVELDQGEDAVKQYKFLNQVKYNAELDPKHLKFTVDEDQVFLNEINLLNNIVAQVESGAVKTDNNRDVFWFVLSGLHAVSDLHGDNSSETVEAKQMLVQTLAKLNEAYKKAYRGNVLVTIVTSDASHTRYARSLLDDDTNPESMIENLNLAPPSNPNFPVMFNIILWFTVAMVFSLLAIVLVIAGMDPGRDSIIYRMTSNRMKKEN